MTLPGYTSFTGPLKHFHLKALKITSGLARISGSSSRRTPRKEEAMYWSGFETSLKERLRRIRCES
jgi:hypothetical protein